MFLRRAASNNNIAPTCVVPLGDSMSSQLRSSGAIRIARNAPLPSRSALSATTSLVLTQEPHLGDDHQ